MKKHVADYELLDTASMPRYVGNEERLQAQPRVYEDKSLYFHQKNPLFF